MMSSISSHHGKPPPQLQLFLIHVFLGIQLSCSLGTYSNQTAVPGVLCRPDQASALLRLQTSFSTDAWGPFDNGSRCTLASWRADTDCCVWEGVHCGDVNGRVTTLDLGDCGLQSGSLHPALFDLTSLRDLNLAWNNFNGSQLPAVGFEHLTELIHLNLSNCGFAGQIPVGIGRLTKLVSLDLSITQSVLHIDNDVLLVASWFQGIFLVEPNITSLVKNLSNLELLYVGHADLSGNGATWCDAFANSTPHLQVLSLQDTKLYAPICESLSSIHSLREVNLQYNQLYGQFPQSFADLPSLSVLKLANNKLEGWFPMRIFQNKNLTVVDIRYNLGISGSLPNFSSQNTLKDLLVSNTNFSGPIPSSIRNLKFLDKLGIAAVDSSHELPSSMGELTSLSFLEVSGAGITGEMSSWIANLTSLLVLRFMNCGLSGQVPSSIGNLKNLTQLYLYACNFSGQIPPQLFNLTQIYSLSLASNHFTGTIKLSSFFQRPELRSLDLSNNLISVVDGEFNSSWTSMKFMDTLRLASCNISKFPDVLRNMSWLQFLDLSENHIHGAIPQWAWETWNYLSALYLSHNLLSSIGYAPVLPGDISFVNISFNLFVGPIPIPGLNTHVLDCSNNMFSSIPLNFVSQLSSISYFKASGNNLSGNIPPSMCEPTNMVLIDLSYNNLSGSIPSCFMENMNSLSVLNLKRNQLHGELPQKMKQDCAFEALDFSDNWIGGQLPRSLVACRQLEVFDIGNNDIDDTFPCWMSKLPKLQVLVLRSNKFSGKIQSSSLIDKTSCAFMELRIFDVSSNNLSGTLPNELFKRMKYMATKSSNETLIMEKDHNLVGEIYLFTTTITFKGSTYTFSKILRTLVVIDISYNAFNGAIPETIGDLILLTAVNMSHNALTGPIPSQFGALQQLESLDLSSNDLSGVIPQELA